RGDLLLAVAPGNQVAAEDLQPAVARPDVLPQVGGAVALRVHWVSCPAVVALVEGQELGSRAGEPGSRPDRFVADGEVHQRAAREVEQRLGESLALGTRVAVEAVLVDRV